MAAVQLLLPCLAMLLKLVRSGEQRALGHARRLWHVVARMRRCAYVIQLEWTRVRCDQSVWGALAGEPQKLIRSNRSKGQIYNTLLVRMVPGRRNRRVAPKCLCVRNQAWFLAPVQSYSSETGHKKHVKDHDG